MRLDSILPVACFEFDIPEFCRQHREEKKAIIANAFRTYRRHPGECAKPITFCRWQSASDMLRAFIHNESFYVMHAEALPCGCIIHHYEGQWKERGQ